MGSHCQKWNGASHWLTPSHYYTAMLVAGPIQMTGCLMRVMPPVGLAVHRVGKTKTPVGKPLHKLATEVHVSGPPAEGIGTAKVD